MASDALHSVPVLLVVTGLALLAVALRLARQGQRQRRAMRSLLQLGSRDMDPLDLPHAAWPALAAGGWRALQWSGDWFGHSVQGQCGRAPEAGWAKPREPLEFSLASGTDVDLNLRFFHSAPRSDASLSSEQLAQVFVLVLEGRLRSRLAALAAALTGRAHLSLQLQHDTRNLVQWVNWVSADFAACASAEALLAAARRLQDNAPLAGERAQRLALALGRQATPELPRRIDLARALGQAARLAGIEPAVGGEAVAWVADSLLSLALDALFSALASDWRESLAQPPVLQLQLRNAPAAQASAAGVQVSACSAWPCNGWRPTSEKLFEPFVGGRPGGLGLGLYQARKILREAGGDLQARATDERLELLLLLPAAPA